MVRKLRFHEKKLLKKVDFISWEVDNNLEEVSHMRKYYVQKREDYRKYHKLALHIKALAVKIRKMDSRDPFKKEATSQLLDKLYAMKIIPTKSALEECNKVSAVHFCRRRLPVIMVKSQMAENLKTAVTFIEQGHVRVGPELVTDPNFLVTGHMEDYITWTDTSAIRKHVLEYNELRDDFDLTA